MRQGTTVLGRLGRLLPVLLVATSLGLTACQGTPGSTPDGPPAPRIAVKPADGTGEWRPDHPVKITSSRGELRNVTVETAEGNRVAGSFNKKHTAWTSTWGLSPDTEFAVTATATNPAGRKATKRTSFTTLNPRNTVSVDSVNAGANKTYGVGLPIVVKFTKPVFNKKRVERAMEVRTSEPITGSWHWMSRRELHFRPKEHWPTGTRVRFVAHMEGVRAAEGTYGVNNVNTEFEIGAEHTTVIDTDSHTMTVKKGDETVKTFDISAGKSSSPTPGGTYVAFLTQRKTRMQPVGVEPGEPGYYDLELPWTVKFTYNGIYTHGYEQTVPVQGEQNVSHGCVNMAPSDAEWYYNFTNVGDLITVEGSPSEQEQGNGWTDWGLSWKEYLEGSATGKPVTTKPLRGDSQPSNQPSPSHS